MTRKQNLAGAARSPGGDGARRRRLLERGQQDRPRRANAAPVNTARADDLGHRAGGPDADASTGSWTSTSRSATRTSGAAATRRAAAAPTSAAPTTRRTSLKHADLGDTLRVRVTAKNADGSAQSTSNQTAVVKAAAGAAAAGRQRLPASGTGPIDVADVALPARLLVDGQTITPSVITRSTTDLTIRFHVSACSGRSVPGALVYATAVPFEQFSIPAETPTGADGWATMTMHQDRGFPASPKQQLLAVFVRARKPGEALLGGISTRRLVSFPVHV